MDTQTPTKSLPATSISRDAAVALIDAVRTAAEKIGFEVATAVTDAGGHLKAFERSDDAPFLAAEVRQPPDTLPSEVVDAFRRASGEALANVANHAGTNRARLTALATTNPRRPVVTVAIVDQGNGF